MADFPYGVKGIVIGWVLFAFVIVFLVPSLQAPCGHVGQKGFACIKDVLVYPIFKVLHCFPVVKHHYYIYLKRIHGTRQAGYFAIWFQVYCERFGWS